MESEIGLHHDVVIETSQRDAAICRYYMNGLTLAQCGAHYGISKERVRQILRKAGVYRSDRSRAARSVRQAFLGVNISEGDKVALAAEAERRGVSMSALTSDLITAMLREVAR